MKRLTTYAKCPQCGQGAVVDPNRPGWLPTSYASVRPHPNTQTGIRCMGGLANSDTVRYSRFLAEHLPARPGDLS